MSLPIRSIDTAQAVTNKAIPNSGVEVAILTSPLVTVPDGSTQIVVMVSTSALCSQSSTSISFHLRRGSGLSGLLLLPDSYTTNFFSTNNLACFAPIWFDQVTAIGTVQYTVTATYTGTDGSGLAGGTRMLILVI